MPKEGFKGLTEVAQLGLTISVLICRFEVQIPSQNLLFLPYFVLLRST